jgi:hypothetical protein
MTFMLGIPGSFEARKDLRIELSDHLLERIGEPWLHDIMVACQELRLDDLNAYRSGGGKIHAAPTAPAPAVADIVALAAEQEHGLEWKPDEETFAAMRWVSKLDDDSCVLGLIRSLPKEVLEEQVSLYRRREEKETAVAAKAKQLQEQHILLGSTSGLAVRMRVAQRFSKYCHNSGYAIGERLPHGAMQSFIKDNIQ